MESDKSKSPWPKRILISGVALVAIGIFSLFAFAGDFTDYYDPRIMAEHKMESGETETFDLEKGCWILFVEGDGDDYTIDANYVKDGTIGDKVGSSCNTDFTAQSSDADFDSLKKLDVKSDSKVTIVIDCEDVEGCENDVLVVNGDDVVGEMLTDGALIFSGLTCVAGLILIPLGWIIIAINRGHDTSVQITQNQSLQANAEFEEEIINPHGEMLTTDDLYKLVRGEIPERESPTQQEVPSPFVNQDTRVKTVQPSSTGGSINRASNYTPENPPTDDSWKNWDEG